jgi:hypothetical protein
VKRIVVVAALRPGGHERAQELLKQGPPFDLAAAAFDRHAVYLSRDEVVFAFEGAEVEWKLDDLISDFLETKLNDTLSDWRDVIEGSPQIAREAFFWERPKQ